MEPIFITSLILYTVNKVAKSSGTSTNYINKAWGEEVLPYKGLMGTCGQPGYVFRDFCLKQGIDFIFFCLNQGINFINFCLRKGVFSWAINSLDICSTN